MEIEHSALEKINFTESSSWRWGSRRILIGSLLAIYYIYALIFIDSFISPNVTGIKVLADVHDSPYLLMTTFGFLGSIYTLSRTFVVTQNRIDYPVVWYITRPLQGVLMALFLYFAFQAGQLMFFNGGGTGAEAAAETAAKEGPINVFTLSILAVLAGLFSEHAYERLFEISENVMKPKPKAKSE